MSKKHITIPIFIPHLGCPFRCIFCNQRHSSGVKSLPHRAEIVSKVKNYLKKIPDTVEHIEIAFFGGSFTGIEPARQEEFLSAANYFLEKGYIKGIRLSTRPDFIDIEKAALLKKYNVSTVELGVQSFSDRVLEASGRGHSSDDSLRAIELLNKWGFNTVIQLMPGLPEDSRERSIGSALTACEMKPSAVRIYPAVVLKNTELCRLFYDKLYAPLTLEQAVNLCKDIYLIFNKRKIPVIRMGIHPLGPDESQTVISGPYHPSFGFLVKSRVKRDLMEAEIRKFLSEKSGRIEKINIIIPSKFSEEYIGTGKENIAYLKNRFNISTLSYKIKDVGKLNIEPGQR